MGGRIRPTRYAHSEGHTDVCYSTDGKFIATCGEDGEVRVFQGLDDDDCMTHSVAEQAYAIACLDDCVVVGTDNNSVQSFGLEDGMPGRVHTRFTARPTCLHVAAGRVAAGGSDMVVRVQDTREGRDSVMEGHTAPILSVALHPTGLLVASSSCDGSVKVWDVETSCLVKTFPSLHTSSNQFSASSTLCRPSFTPCGGSLMVPQGDKIVVYSRAGNWVKEREFGHPDDTTAVSIVCVSPCGAMVATATGIGGLTVFEAKTGVLICAVQHPKKLAICGLAWNPNKSKRELAFVDMQGQLGTVVDLAVGVTTKTSDKNVNNATAGDVFPPPGVDDHLDDFPPLDVDENINMDNLDEGGDNDNEISLALIKSQMGFADDEHGTFLGLPTDNADGTGQESPAPPIPEAVPSPAPAGPRLPELQRCFTPSMTPEHHTQRYMLWNGVGVVRQYNLDEDCSIGVEFHDSSLHHSIHRDNSAQAPATIAALSDAAFVLAAEATGDCDAAVLSRVMVQMLSGGGGGAQDWQVELPEGEDVTTVAASSEIVAVASDRRIVRVLSVFGACGGVLCIPGPLVCLAAHKHHLMMLYHAGTGAGGDQQIHMLILNTQPSSSFTTPSPPPLRVPVALSPGAFVSWAGFSDEGSPVVVDSHGLVRVLHPRHHNIWTVLLDTKAKTKGRSDHYFVVGVSEAEGKVRAILCRGARFPPLVPTPYVALLDFNVPVLEQNSEKGEFESCVLQAGVQLSTLGALQRIGERDYSGTIQDIEVMLQTTLVKLFALACKGGREGRARDVCALMTERTLHSALKYAAKLGRTALAERIGEDIQRRRDDDDQQQREEPQRYPHELSSVSAHYSANESYADHLNLTASRIVASATSQGGGGGGDCDREVEGQGEEEDEDADIIEPTQAAAEENPLLAAAARRQQHNLSLRPSMKPSASTVNPFKKSTAVVTSTSASGSSGTAKKGLGMLDDYRAKPVAVAPILRPTLKKKSKAERGLSKPLTQKGMSQPSIMSQMKNFTKGKENKSEASNTKNVTNGNNPGDSQETFNAHLTNTSIDSSIEQTVNVDSDKDLSKLRDTACKGAGINDDTVSDSVDGGGGPALFKDSSMFRPHTAMHLWWADNEAAVRGSSEDDVRKLVPRAALMFKDLADEVKTKYKKLASENTGGTTTVNSIKLAEQAAGVDGDGKRKRQESQNDINDCSIKKSKPGSGIDKLAAFAFSK